MHVGTYLFAVKIHLSHVSPDRLAATRNFPCLPASRVIPRQLRQSNSPNVIQSGFTCDASSSIYCCNWDVRTGTVKVPTGWVKEPYSSTLASRELIPPSLSPRLSFLPPTTFSLSPAPRTSSIPNGGIDHQPECSETAPRPRCSQQGPKKPLILTHGPPNRIPQWTCDPVNSLQQTICEIRPCPSHVPSQTQTQTQHPVACATAKLDCILTTLIASFDLEEAARQPMF
jgi:hypothetical protein